MNPWTHQGSPGTHQEPAGTDQGPAGTHQGPARNSSRAGQEFILDPRRKTEQCDLFYGPSYPIHLTIYNSILFYAHTWVSSLSKVTNASLLSTTVFTKTTLLSLSYYCTLKITTVSYLETNEIKGTMPSELGTTVLYKPNVLSPVRRERNCTQCPHTSNYNYILLILRIKLLRNSLRNHPEIPNNTKKSEFRTKRNQNSQREKPTAEIKWQHAKIF
jgi:hypothetical protein